MAVHFSAVGDLMLDVTARGRGHSARVRVTVGGSAANAARWAVVCGAQATAVGAVGDDAAGRLLRAELERAGVRAALAVDTAAPTGTFLVVDGEVRADRGANARLAPDDLPEELAGDVVLVSAYLPPATVESALARAQAPFVALAAGRLDQLPAGGNALLANEDEARRLTGLPAEQAVRRLAEGRRLACVTLGAEGAVAVLDGGLASARPPAREPEGAAGAGDAFAAALLVALARGLPLADALAEGCRRGHGAAARAG
jgi:sugar/nucleoside kinase (ribokinase family)